MGLYDLALSRPIDLALEDGRVERSFAELLDRVSRVARYLRDVRGLRPGDHAALVMDNRAEYVEIVLGALHAGVWLTPVNRHLSAEEIAYVIEDSGAAAVFADEAHADLCPAGPLLAGAPLERALASVSGEPVPREGPAGGVMMYTSGTTGRPKGVRRARPPSVAALEEAQARIGGLLGLDGSGPHLVTGPLYHAAPLLFGLYDLQNGAPLLVRSRFDAEAFLAEVDARGIAHTHLVPTMFVRLLRLPEEVRARFSGHSLRLVLHGAAPVAEEVKRRMIEWWGETLLEYWGATEGGVYTLVDSSDWLARPGTVGRPLDAYRVFAAGDDGRELPPGEVGTLCCAHRELAEPFAYHRDPEKTARAYVAPGAFTVGDLGHVDADGYVFLSARRGDLVLVGGVNVYPAQVEAALLGHEAVADVVVYGAPDEEWGERVCATVQTVAGTREDETLARALRERVRARLGALAVPSTLRFEVVPRLPSGKVRQAAPGERHGREE